MTDFAFFSNCKFSVGTESKDASPHHLKHFHLARNLNKLAVCMEWGVLGVWGTCHDAMGVQGA